MKVEPFKKFNGVFTIGGQLATINATPGSKVYGEKLIKIEGKEYRIWDYCRSKPAAALKKGLKKFPLQRGMKVLYLGIASGTTASHFSDIVGEEGIIYGVDIAERVLRDLVAVAQRRGNIITILADARKPEEYADKVMEKVDLVFEDVADPDQIEIFIRNCQKFLKPNGYGMIAVKSRSIDVVKNPNDIYKDAEKRFSKIFEIIDFVTLDPYEKDHGFFVCVMK